MFFYGDIKIKALCIRVLFLRYSVAVSTVQFDGIPLTPLDKLASGCFIKVPVEATPSTQEAKQLSADISVASIFI